MTYKVAIIGCGMIAGLYEDFDISSIYSHAKAYSKHKDFGEMAFYDSDSERAKLLAEKVDGKTYNNLNEILSLFQPDIVSLCVPDDLHFKMTQAILMHENCPKLIFAEKPVCEDQSELNIIKQLESNSNSKVLVNHSRRFDKAHERLRKLFKNGDLGSLVRIHVDYYGGWRHLGVHVVDILQYFFNEEINLNKLEYFCESKYSSDPTLNVNGNIGSATIDFQGHLEEFYQILDINIMCQQGQVKLSDFGNKIEVFRKIINAENENVLLIDKNFSEVGMESPMKTAIDIISEFLRNADHDRLLPYGLSEANKTMRTLWKGTEIYAARS